VRLSPPSPVVWVRIHSVLILLWIGLTVPAVLFWKDSVPFLVFLSVYANIAGSVASWTAAKADTNSPTREDLVRLEARVVALLRRTPEQ
jgi:hypothetical protein